MAADAGPVMRGRELPLPDAPARAGAWIGRGLTSSHLLWLYAPTALLFAWWLAVAALGVGVPAWAPDTDRQPAWYWIVFGMPHIVASFFAFGDPALARECRRPLWRATAIAMTVTAVTGLLLSPLGQMTVMVAVTLVHVTHQQTGLALGQARLGGMARWLGVAWKWGVAAAGCAAALAIGGETLQGPLVAQTPALALAELAMLATTPLAMALFVLAWRAHGDGRSILAMQMTLLVAYALVRMDQPLLGVALLRWTHDATAFALYAALAAAREADAPGANRLWRPLRWIRLEGRRVAWAVLPAALLINVLLVWALPPLALNALIYLHYAAEKPLWRSGSPLRRSLPLR